MDLKNNYIINTTEEFEGEYHNILNYIVSSLKEPKTAQELDAKIKRKISSLNFFPERCQIVSPTKFKDENIRRLIINDYIVVYKVDKLKRHGIHFTYLSWQTKLSNKILIKDFLI